VEEQATERDKQIEQIQSQAQKDKFAESKGPQFDLTK
jgi:hypothetical protein